jgi:hypothetical protein
MITDDRKAVKRSIAAAEASGAIIGLPLDRKRTLDSMEDSDDVVMHRHIRQRTSNYVPPTSHEYPGSGLPSVPYKPGKPQPSLYTQPSPLHPSLAHPVASLEAVIPNKGPLRGGIQVVVMGVNLTPNSTISFGGIPPVDQVYTCDRMITCTLPRALSPGSVAVSLGGVQTDPKVLFPSFTYESEGNDSGM